MTELFQEPVMNDPEIVPQPTGYSAYVTDEATLLHDINNKLAVLISKSESHTAAVNQFGRMLDHVVQSVTGFSQMMQTQGIGGLLKMMGGAKNDG